MAKFLVSVEGKLVVDAGDKTDAKVIVAGILAAKQPWLSPAYGDPVKIAEASIDVTDALVATPQD